MDYKCLKKGYETSVYSGECLRGGGNTSQSSKAESMETGISTRPDTNTSAEPTTSPKRNGETSTDNPKIVTVLATSKPVNNAEETKFNDKKIKNIKRYLHHRERGSVILINQH